jgi:hypothetical protein
MREARYRESIFMFFEDVLNLVFASAASFHNVASSHV